jgi:hypothetical protein
MRTHVLCFGAFYSYYLPLRFMPSSEKLRRVYVRRATETCHTTPTFANALPSRSWSGIWTSTNGAYSGYSAADWTCHGPLQRAMGGVRHVSGEPIIWSEHIMTPLQFSSICRPHVSWYAFTYCELLGVAFSPPLLCSPLRDGIALNVGVLFLSLQL